jgi:hypothetical protein
MVIHPYLDNGVWVFDDSATGLVKEPFVAGIPEIIEQSLGKKIKSFTAIFSSTEFPGYTDLLMREEPIAGGYFYRHKASGLKGWLCPALFKYFSEAPENIYCQMKAN